MITIKNSQRSITVNSNVIKKKARLILTELGYADFDLGIWLTTNSTIRRYNKQYRYKDKATDVLSFPFHPELKAGEKIVAHTPDDKNLGDLIISLEYVQKDAHNWDHSFAQHLDFMLVHGICHLLGYDHIEDADYEVMKAQESKLLEVINR